MAAHDDNYMIDALDEHNDAPPAYRFNPDPSWQQFITRFEPEIEAIAIKYCTTDEDLREDVKQEARVGLATTFPEQVDGFELYARGQISEDQWDKALDRYCRNVIRNSILSYLDSYPKGNWYIGRTRHVKDKRTGDTKKVYLPPRFSSLDEMSDMGMQVDEDQNISWQHVGEYESGIHPNSQFDNE